MVTHFPGGTAVTGLAVYPWEAEDGRCGGSPHMHLACSEAYVTVSGTGSVQTLTAAGLQETPLEAGTVVWFDPGTVHRAVNHGDLKIVVVMQNGGLPEAGDAVLTFPPEVLADRATYDRAASGVVDEESARRRRDLAVRGFLALAQDGGALEAFYRQAVALVADRVPAWEERWRNGPGEVVRLTGEHLAALREGRIEHLLRAEVRTEGAHSAEERKFGMCGRLDTYPSR